MIDGIRLQPGRSGEVARNSGSGAAASRCDDAESERLDYSCYPDVTAVGDLRSALQDQFDAVGMPLHAQGRVLAWVRPLGEGRYLVAGPNRRQPYGAGPLGREGWDTNPVSGALGPAPAQESVALVLTVMDRDVQG
jgi:hypothetical protein